MSTILTRKFSQFNPQTVARGVGLGADGSNSIGPSGSGGGGSVTGTETQTNSFTLGQVIYFNENTQLYELALATTKELAEAYAIVVGVGPESTPPYSTFTWQQAGKITTASGVFPAGSFIGGQPQFLSDSVPGALTPNDVLIDGEISKPIFLPDSDSSGLVAVLMRGIVAGGGPDTGAGGGNGQPGTSRVTVEQNGHGFNPGDIVRVDTPTAGPNQVHYVKADASTFDNSLRVGFVIKKIDNNSFVLQFSDYIADDTTNGFIAPFQDEAGNPLIPKRQYYLSATPNSGAMTLVDPATTYSGYSVPVYIPEQTPTTVNYNAGYIQPQRTLSAYIANPQARPWVFLGSLTNGGATPYSSQTILQDSNGNTYKAYRLIIYPGSVNIATYGIKAVTAGNTSIGIQYYKSGAWQSALGTYASYISGVTSSAGPDTATWWGYVRNSAGVTPDTDKALLMKPTAQDIILLSGEILLRNDSSRTEMDFNVLVVDPVPIAPFGVGYTSVGWSGGGGGAAPATGFRVVFSAGATISPTCVGYIEVYGIPD